MTEKKGHRPKQTRAAIWRPKFLAAFRQTGNVTRSAEIAEVSKQGAYKAYHSNAQFRAAWDKAEGESTKLLEDEAFHRAKDGVMEPVYYQGKVVGHVRKPSDILLIFLLKARKPEMYRDNYQPAHDPNNTGRPTVEGQVPGWVDYIENGHSKERVNGAVHAPD